MLTFFRPCRFAQTFLGLAGGVFLAGRFLFCQPAVDPVASLSHDVVPCAGGKVRPGIVAYPADSSKNIRNRLEAIKVLR